MRATFVFHPLLDGALIIPVIAGSCLSSGITVSRVQRRSSDVVISTICYYRGALRAEYKVTKKNVDEAESLLNIASRVIGEFCFEHFFIDREYYTRTYADCRKLKNSRVFYRVFNHFSPYYARNSQFCSYVVYYSDSLIIFLSLSVSRRSLNGGKRKGGKEDNGWNSDFV